MIGIYGANGFIGRHLTRRLLAERRKLVTVARNYDARPESDERPRVVTADLRDRDLISRSLDGVSTVVQLMGCSTPAQGNARTTEDIKSNVIPHVEFLNLCIESGVRRFVFLSSGGAVYGPVDSVPVPETAATNPISSHGVTKLMVEKFIELHAQQDGLDYVILRVANPFGPGQVFRNGQGLIPALLKRYREGQPVTILGDGSAGRDYVYIDDVVDAIVAAVDLPDRARVILNVGTGVSRSIIEVVRTIETVGDLSFELERVPARPSDVPNIALDISRARQVLGWEPRTDFKDGVARTVAQFLGEGAAQRAGVVQARSPVLRRGMTPTR